MSRFRSFVGALFGAMTLSLALFAAGCGGGGGGGGGEDVSGDRDPIGDVDTPRIVSVFPAPNAIDVDLGTQIRITFETEIIVPSLQGDRIRAVTAEGTLVDSSLLFEDGNRTIIIDPTLELPRSARIDVIVDAGIQDVGANTRTTAFTYSFRTPQSTPSGSLPFETGSIKASLEIMKLARDGTGVAIYQQIGFSTSLVAQQLVNGIPTNAPKVIITGSELFSIGESGLAVASGGQAVVTWRQDLGGDSDTFAAFLDPQSGEWEVAELENSATQRSETPLAAIASSGRATIVWLESPVSGSPRRVRRAVRFRPGDTAIDDLSGPFQSSDLSLAMNESGRGVAAWIEESTPGNTVVKSSTIALAVPQFPIDVETRSFGTEERTRVGVNDGGRFIIAWIENIPGFERVLAATGIGQPTVIQPPKNLHQDPIIVSLDVTGAGNSGVVLFSSLNGTAERDLFGARFRVERNEFDVFEVAENLRSDSFVAFDATANGDVAALFQSGADATLQAVMWRTESDPQTPVSIPSANGVIPSIAFEPDGGALFAYGALNVAGDPLQGSHAEVRRIAVDGGVLGAVSVSSEVPPKKLEKVAVAVDGQGNGVVLSNEADVGANVLDIVMTLFK